RGWYHGYGLLQGIDAVVRPGAGISVGKKVGVVGMAGGGGGWWHLDVDITGREPSGLWGIQEGYAFIWGAYERQYAPNIIGVARFAELLRGSKWVQDSSYAAVLEQLAQLPPQFQSRPEFSEVRELVAKAQMLSVKQWAGEISKK